MNIRKADKAGSWYQANPGALEQEIEECLARAEEQYGRIPVLPGKRPTALVAPHAGLFFSGAVAAAAFRLIQDAWGEVDTFVVFGACHRGNPQRPAIWADGSWRTPLGVIGVDSLLADLFVREGVGEANHGVHLGDNAIELQTPFIKYLFPKARIVPIAMSPYPDSWRYGETASRLSREHGGVVIAIASTDLTHYGESFGLMPAGVGDGALAWTRENDTRFLEALVKVERYAIVPLAMRDHSACGAGAAAAAAGWARERGCDEGRILAYTNSYEVLPQGEADHLVGYGSVAFDVEWEPVRNGVGMSVSCF